jgi:hypothetical protein
LHRSFDVVAPVVERTECLSDAASSGILLMRLLVDFNIVVALRADLALSPNFGLSLLLSLHEAGEGLHFVD